jgi:hypothetical protein
LQQAHRKDFVDKFFGHAESITSYPPIKACRIIGTTSVPVVRTIAR